MKAFFSAPNVLASGTQISTSGAIVTGYPASQVYDSSPQLKWRPGAGNHTIVHRLADTQSTVTIGGVGFQMVAGTDGTVSVATSLSQAGPWTDVVTNHELRRCVFAVFEPVDTRYIRFTFTNIATGGATFTHLWAGDTINAPTPAPHKTLGTGFADFYKVRGRRAIDGGIFDSRSYYLGQRTRIDLQVTPTWVTDHLIALRDRLLTTGAYFAWNAVDHAEQVGYVRSHNPPVMPMQTAAGTLVVSLDLEAP